MSTKKLNANQIDQVLPQTQCGLCEYDGCLPYAQAIAYDGERIDRCPPGGIRVLKELGTITGIDPTRYIPEMEKKSKPAQKVFVREDECIGCTKCIQACPVDAILGASKQKHTVIADECTGCELCIEPCPMDCIDIIPATELDIAQQRQFSDHNRVRYRARDARLARLAHEQKTKHSKAKIVATDKSATIDARRSAIMEAVQRTKAKKES